MIEYINFNIKKLNNGEYKEVNKIFNLNVNKYVTDTTRLYFDEEGKKTPYLVAHDRFFSTLCDQMQGGLIEALNYDDDNGILKVTARDGNIIKNYTYNFNYNAFTQSLHSRLFDELRESLLQLSSIYNEDPIISSASEGKYLSIISDIIDGDRKVILDSPEEIKRVLEVYNAHKNDILEALLDNIVFYDSNGNEREFRSSIIKEKALDYIKSAVKEQIEFAIQMFIQDNNAQKIYDDYLETIFIPARNYIEDENEKETQTEEPEKKSLFYKSKDFLEKGVYHLKESTSRVLKRKV